MTDWPIKGLCDHCGAPYRGSNSCLYCGKERWDISREEMTERAAEGMRIVTRLVTDGVVSMRHYRELYEGYLKTGNLDFAAGYAIVPKSWK